MSLDIPAGHGPGQVADKHEGKMTPFPLPETPMMPTAMAIGKNSTDGQLQAEAFQGGKAPALGRSNWAQVSEVAGSHSRSPKDIEARVPGSSESLLHTHSPKLASGNL